MAIGVMTLRILLVDDDATILRVFRNCLEQEEYRVSVAKSFSEATSLLSREAFDICVLDVNLGETSGMDLLTTFRELAPWTRVIMVTAMDDVALALTAIRSGAADYIVKPCTPEQLSHAVGQQAEARRLERRIEALEKNPEAQWEFFLGTRNLPLAGILDTVKQVATTDATILLLGESGTGKSLLARTIHAWSHRSKAVMATVSCPSLSPELLESELFGHVRGAFTGAIENRPGRIQVADGGTLFFDEVGDLPLSLQPKLLRFLQDHEYERVGDPHSRSADVRVIAATNRDLGAMVNEGYFREELFYRLNVIAITLPALRDRREDILPLIEGLLLHLIKQYDSPARHLDKTAATILTSYHWPGNLRELRNVMERAVILCTGDTIRPEHLPFSNHGTILGSNGARAGDPISLTELERAHIQAILASAPTLEAAATTLGIDASTLYRKRRQYQMQ